MLELRLIDAGSGGKFLKPEGYVALGISGAVQDNVGMQGRVTPLIVDLGAPEETP